MLSSSSYGRKARDMLAMTSVVGATCFYVSNYSHDNRALSDEEVSLARRTLARITPPSNVYSSTSCIQLTQQTHDAIVSSHATNLSKYGATVIKGTLSPQQLNEWNGKTMTEFDAGRNTVWNSGRAHISIDERSTHYLDMVRIGGNDIDISTDDAQGIEKISWMDGLWWPIRKRRRGRSNNHETIEPNVSLQHIVQSYFEQHGIERYMITQLQFLNAYPNSTNQIWHRDNKFMGLTAIVALQNIRTNGPTELILGSHQEDYSAWSQCWNCMQSYLPVNLKQSDDNDHDIGVNEENSLLTMPLLGCIDAGDAIIYDARIFHRGRGYPESEEEGKNVDRPVMVLRWDASNTPPPGAGLIVTSANKYLGSIMYALLFAMQKISEFSIDKRT